MDRTVGIDLGTTNSAVAAVTEGEPDILINSEGNRTTPSVVHFPGEDEVIVGAPARNQMVARPETTVARVKRHMGRDDWTAEIHGESYTPEDISSMTLQKLRSDAADALNEEIASAVITVPAYFGERQREATEAAGRLAGLDVRRIINEPTAACLAYGLDKEDVDGELALVYDLGGGTFDASLVDIGHGVIEVLSTNGDEHLGGEDFDETLYEHIRDEFIDAGNPDPADDLQLKSQLLEEAKKAKETLSSQQTVEIIEPFLGPEGLELEIDRETFNDVAGFLVEDSIDVVEALFEEVDHGPEDVDEVILIGGSTRIPLVQEQVAAYFGQDPTKEVNPDEAVAIGASIQAAILDASDQEGEDGEQAERLLPGGAEDLLLVDVCPKSLGIRLHDGSFDPIIERNEQIPAYNSKSGYSTVQDNQTSVQVEIYEGEDETATENEHLGEFKLTNIPPQPAGSPRFRLDFELDESGILHAEATDEDRDESEEIVIEDVFGMSDEEIADRKENLPQYAGN